MDAVQEVSIQTSNFAAEYGQAAGGYFNFTMKSGTNQYHGSLYDYMRNEALNAGLPYTDRCSPTACNADSMCGLVSVSMTGVSRSVAPLDIPKLYNGKNRSFFFFNFEQFLVSNTVAAATATVPTTAYQNGNFATPFVNALGVTTNIGPTPTCTTVISAACPAIGGLTYATQSGVIAHDGLGALIPEYGVYDPRTVVQTSTGPVTSLFPNGIIPANRMDPVALKIQSLLPQPTNGNLTANYIIPTYSNFTHTINWSTKIDQSLSPTSEDLRILLAEPYI